MEGLNPNFALYGIKNEYARTDTVLSLSSQVCTRAETFNEKVANYGKSVKKVLKKY